MCSSAFLLSQNVGLLVRNFLGTKGSFFREKKREKENTRSSTVVFDILTAIKSVENHSRQQIGSTVSEVFWVAP